MDAKQTVKAFVHAINSQDWPRLDSLVAMDFVRHSIAAADLPVRSRSDLVMYLRREFEIFPDAQEIILDIFAEGKKVAVRHHFSGTERGVMGSHLPTGRTIRAEYIAIYRVRNGRLIEAWAEWDNLAGLRQLGHLLVRFRPRIRNAGMGTCLINAADFSFLWEKATVLIHVSTSRFLIAAGGSVAVRRLSRPVPRVAPPVLN